jgi:hypothetical protein
MKYLLGGLAFGVGVPVFLVGCLTLNPGIATGGAFLTMVGVQQFG